MDKIKLITWREYITRVRKKSFIIMTLAGPLLIAGFYAVVFYLMLNENLGSEERHILVLDGSGMFEDKLASKSPLFIEYRKGETKEESDSLLLEKYDGWLTIPAQLDIYNPRNIVYRSAKNINLQTKEDLNDQLSRAIGNYKMEAFGVSKNLIDSVKTSVSIRAVTIEKDGSEKDSSTELFSFIGLALSMAIYMFIFLYGVQVMRGVLEEKSNRIVEIVISSVKPFQLMMGKVLGLAMVGITQILIWVILSGVLITGVSLFFGGDLGSLQEMGQQAEQMQQMSEMQQGMENMDISKFEEIKNALFELNFSFIISAFLFYFLAGYLMYSSLFAAVGAAADSETDTQQFMLPITLPLVFAFFLSMSVVLRDPNGPMAFWLSIFPLTSPIVMMVRLPFLTLADQWWEVLLSAVILIGSFCGTIWLAAKIYRVGILMYGKKVSYKEIFKWLRHGS